LKIILHFKDGTSNELNPMIAKMLVKVVNINELINNPSSQKSSIGKFVKIDNLRSVEILL
jgi:hypothetical protein